MAAGARPARQAGPHDRGLESLALAVRGVAHAVAGRAATRRADRSADDQAGRRARGGLLFGGVAASCDTKQQAARAEHSEHCSHNRVSNPRITCAQRGHSGAGSGVEASWRACCGATVPLVQNDTLCDITT